jgi:hypothetical protein
LGYEEGEVVAVCHQTAHGGERGLFAHAHVPATADAIGAEASRHVDTSDLWWSVNTLAVPEGYQGRGTAEHVFRWVGIYADLDVKAGGLPSLEAAEAVIDAVSAMLGHDPVTVLESGHGLQPVWAMDPADDGTDLAGDEERRATARALMRRFGRLMTHVASLVDEEHRGRVDSVFDIARVLRLPGTVNRKDPDVPVPTGVRFPGGSPLGVGELAEQLTAYGVTERPGDRDDPGEVRSEPGSWAWAERPCSTYPERAIAGWRTDPVPGGRHPWLVRQAVRLACMHRAGCLTRAQHEEGARVLAERMDRLCTKAEGDQYRQVAPGEVAGALAWGVARAAAKTDAELDAELGHHRHSLSAAERAVDFTGPPAETTGTEPLAKLWGEREVLQHLHDFARARRVAPAAVLCYALAQTVAMIPPGYVFPADIVGGVGTLNAFYALGGKPGRGKGAAGLAAHDALVMRVGPPGASILAPWSDRLAPGEPLYVANVGSGEGLAAMYAVHVPKVRNGPPAHQRRTRECALFNVPEVDHIAAVGARSGATLMETLRSVFSGEAISPQYADPTKRLRIDAHSYRCTMLVGVQPRKAGPLLDDPEGGTPQRFVWSRTDDPGAPRVKPPAPPPRTLRLPPTLSGDTRSVVAVPASVREELDAVQWQKLTDAAVEEGLDGHRGYVRLKVAGALAALSEHLDTDGVTEEDWRLAGVLMAESDRVREWFVAEERQAAHESQQARGRAQAVQLDEVENSAVRKACQAIRTKLGKQTGDGWLAASTLRRDIDTKHREHFEDALSRLEGAGDVEVAEVTYNGAAGRRVRTRR